jgi:Ser/Thr protein kinase RdoA (MazF antagonist)
MKSIVEKFAIQGVVKDVQPLGSGLINDTYKVETDGPAGYVLQRINHAIFKDVVLLQNNIEAVTAHIRAKLEAAGEEDIDRKVLKFIPLKDSARTWWFDGTSYWRVSVLIADSLTIDTVNPEYSYYAGKAFGNFQSMLSDIKETLGETIPDFHNMELRERQLADAVAADAVGRMASGEVQAILAQMHEYMNDMTLAERLHREGILPKRICHCDTKVSNMLFDKSGQVLCVIDLDTVMPSFIFSDYGDFLRTAANKVAEDSPELNKVEFDMEIFKAFTKGYIESASSFLTDVERENLPYAAALFPFMQAVRFFTDYINGDTYYKIAYPEHNLVRTRNQMALFHSVIAHKEEMEQFIKTL